MAKTCKYQKYRKYVSFDNGQTWSPLDEYRDGELIEYDSPDCGGGTTEYRWVSLNQYCEDTDLYAHQKKQVSYDGGQTWQDTNPLVTQEVLIEVGSAECEPTPPTPIPQYKWVVVNEYCDGLDLYEHQKQQVSYDSGSTWQDTNPLVTQEVLIEAGSASCEPTPPPPTTYKVVKHYGTGNTSSVECNSESALTHSEVSSGGSRTSITSAEIGTCVQKIDYRAFKNCSSLTNVTIPNSVTIIGSSAFTDCSSLSSMTIPDSVTIIDTYAFTNCSSLSSITIPDSVTTIYNYTFASCSSLTSVTIPSGVTGIYTAAFSNCSSLPSITIPDNVTSIGYSAFTRCYSLSSVTIPNGVTSIGEYAFAACSGLTSVTIGSGITSIGTYAFSNCSSLTSVTITATTPPTLGYNAFSSIGNFTIFVPTSSVETYKSASGWRSYASQIQAIP